MVALRGEASAALNYARAKQGEAATAVAGVAAQSSQIDNAGQGDNLYRNLEALSGMASSARKASRASNYGSALAGSNSAKIGNLGDEVASIGRSAGLTQKADDLTAASTGAKNLGGHSSEFAKSGVAGADNLRLRNTNSLTYADDVRPPSQCFVAGTPVLMSNGRLKPIEQVKIGDQVLARDALTGHTAAKRVSHTFVRHAPATLSLQLSNGEHLETTAEHPFYVEGKGWTAAGEIGLGTSIVTRAGPSLALAQSVPLAHGAARVTVYNFTVEDYHSYFVGQSSVWVHNAGEGGICDKIANQDTAKKIGEYTNGQTFFDQNGDVYTYSDSVKNLDLRGKSADEIHELLTVPGTKWKHKKEYLENPDFPTAFPHDIYYHPDGGMVRVKRNGQAVGSVREPPHYSKSVQKVPGEDTSFDNEAFKVDTAGAPGPKSPNPNEFKYPEGTTVFEADGRTYTPEAVVIADKEMDRLHTNLPD